jgi:hypothetical protein
VLRRPVETTAFIKHVDYFQLRRDRGVGDKAKLRALFLSTRRLNSNVQAEQRKHVLSLTSNDRFEAPDETITYHGLWRRRWSFSGSQCPNSDADSVVESRNTWRVVQKQWFAGRGYCLFDWILGLLLPPYY